MWFVVLFVMVKYLELNELLRKESFVIVEVVSVV